MLPAARSQPPMESSVAFQGSGIQLHNPFAGFKNDLLLQRQPSSLASQPLHRWASVSPTAAAAAAVAAATKPSAPATPLANQVIPITASQRRAMLMISRLKLQCTCSLTNILSRLVRQGLSLAWDVFHFVRRWREHTQTLLRVRAVMPRGL